MVTVFFGAIEKCSIMDQWIIENSTSEERIFKSENQNILNKSIKAQKLPYPRRFLNIFYVILKSMYLLLKNTQKVAQKRRGYGSFCAFIDLFKIFWFSDLKVLSSDVEFSA
jgi:hypothetical protein